MSQQWVVIETYRHDTWAHGPYDTLDEAKDAAAELEDEVPEDERHEDDGFNTHTFEPTWLVPAQKRKRSIALS